MVYIVDDIVDYAFPRGIAYRFHDHDELVMQEINDFAYLLALADAVQSMRIIGKRNIRCIVQYQEMLPDSEVDVCKEIYRKLPVTAACTDIIVQRIQVFA